MDRKKRWMFLAILVVLGVSATSLEADAGLFRRRIIVCSPLPERQEKDLVKITAQVPGVITVLGNGRLKVGDRVEKGQLLVQLDDAKAQFKLEKQKAKAVAAQAEERASDATRDEAFSEWERNQRLYTQKSASLEELNRSKLTYVRYVEEAKTKAEGVKLAELAVKQAEQQLELHRLRSPVRGIVREVYKVRGEGVKALESVILIEALE